MDKYKLDSLANRAAAAEPPAKKRKRRGKVLYEQLYPIYRDLVIQRDFGFAQAARFLIADPDVPIKDTKANFQSLNTAMHKRFRQREKQA